MHQLEFLPFDLTLSVGASTGAMLLGVWVWWRNKWVMGNLLYGLIAIIFSFWSVSDWLVSLESTALPFQIFAWKIIFYLSVCLGPALVIHATIYLSKHGPVRRIKLAYLLSCSSFLVISIGQIAKLQSYQLISPEVFFLVGSVFTLVLYAVALLFLAIELYPMLHSHIISEQDKRRAVYGIMILVPFLVSGGMQFISGPFPAAIIIALLEIWFLFFSLLSFIRASFLDISLSAVEAFLIFLASYATINLLGSRDWVEAFGVLVGSGIVGIFGYVAVISVKQEKSKRESLEKINRELKALEEAKTDFVDMMAHQIRSPLGYLRSSADMMVSGDFGPLSEGIKKTASQIKDTATRMLYLADACLNTSRIDIGKFNSLRELTDVRQLVKKVMDELSSQSTNKKLLVKSEVQPNIPKEIMVDSDVLQNSLYNLLDNAIKYSTSGEIVIKIEIEKRSLVLSVIDSGQGITEDEYGKLFNRFQRGNSATNRGGTGLGLFIVKRLIEAAHGEISVFSEGRGKGSVFKIKLPIEN